MKKKLLALLMSLTMTAALIGCGSADQTANAETAETAETTEATEETTEDTVEDTASSEAEATEEASAADLSGTISLAGSTSMEKLCEAMSESFMETYPGVTVTVEYTGSGAGLESLASGSVDIGNSSRHLKDEEVAGGAVENVVAIDGIAVIVDPANSVSDIPADKLAAIYKGEITNWSDLGGNDEAIVVIGRESGSGTRDAFEELLEVKDACKYAQELDSTGGVKAKVAATPGAIGYVSLDVVDESIKAVSIDSVEPTEANIIAGDYLLSRPFVMATNGEISAQNDLVKGWFDYISSDAGKDVIKSVGLIIPQ
ncbi:MAG: phosphate ABC transporter substrate-binding protein [Lachnospiraceae bacterium]|nr:phosphate ABC transporter substrate-binding protein [Lachnospiraceae bacterium]